jgi:hypothetical protein
VSTAVIATANHAHRSPAPEVSHPKTAGPTAAPTTPPALTAPTAAPALRRLELGNAVVQQPGPPVADSERVNTAQHEQRQSLAEAKQKMASGRNAQHQGEDFE